MAKSPVTTTDEDRDREVRILLLFLRRCAHDVVEQYTNAGFVRSRAYDIVNAANDYLYEHGGKNV